MCPHLKLDAQGFYCGKNYDTAEDEWVEASRRGLCSFASICLWCEDDERYHICITYAAGFGVPNAFRHDRLTGELY